MGRVKKIPRILFFTNGHATDEDYTEAAELGPGVAFRRADLIRKGEPLETFDKVAGAVPPAYEAKAAEKASLDAENPPAEAPKVEGEPVVNAKQIVPPAPPAPEKAPAPWKPNA